MYNADVRQFQHHRWARMILVCGLALTGGCAHQSRVSLVQPQLSGLQRDIRLRSQQGYWADDGRTRRLLVEFPLPGAATGQPNYLLYLRVPHAITTQPTPTMGSVISGFFIQTRGENAGLAVLQDAKVSLLPRQLPGPEDFAVELKFDDGSHLGGLLQAERSEHHLRLFETEQRTADVEAAIRRQSHK